MRILRLKYDPDVGARVRIKNGPSSGEIATVTERARWSDWPIQWFVRARLANGHVGVYGLDNIEPAEVEEGKTNEP